MTTVQPTYTDAHAFVVERLGKAQEYPCADCGTTQATKMDWSFNHPLGVEWLFSPAGPFTYGVLSHYSPRCVSCHMKFDTFMDPSGSRARQRSIRASQGGLASAAAMRSNPEHKETQRQNGINISRKNNESRWSCNECSMVCNRGNMARHQKFSGHSGFTYIEA